MKISDNPSNEPRKMDKLQNTIRGELEALKQNVNDDQENTWNTLNQGVSKETFARMCEVTKSTYEQVIEEQTQIKGEICALTATIEYRVHEISREMEPGRRVPTTSRAFDIFPEVSEIRHISPQRVGLGEMQTRLNTGKPQKTDHYWMNRSDGKKRKKAIDTRQHPQSLRFPTLTRQDQKQHGGQRCYQF